MNRELLEVAEKDKEALVVLYYLPDNTQPYATWLASKDNPENTYWGHYFDTLEEAQEDFDKRSFTEKQRARLDHLLWALAGPRDKKEDDEDPVKYLRYRELREEIEKKFRGY